MVTTVLVMPAAAGPLAFTLAQWIYFGNQSAYAATLESPPPLLLLGCAVVADVLEDTVTRQLETQVREAVTTLMNEAMSERGVQAKKIEVETDISVGGDIYIQHVTVTVDKQNVPQAKLAGEVLSTRLKVPVEVITA